MRFRGTSHSTWRCYGLFLKEILNVSVRMAFRNLVVSFIRDAFWLRPCSERASQLIEQKQGRLNGGSHPRQDRAHSLIMFEKLRSS